MTQHDSTTIHPPSVGWRSRNLKESPPLTTERAVAMMEEKLRQGLFTVEHYIEMWSERLGKERKDVQDILKQVNEVRPHPEFQKIHLNAEESIATVFFRVQQFIFMERSVVTQFVQDPAARWATAAGGHIRRSLRRRLFALHRLWVGRGETSF